MRVVLDTNVFVSSFFGGNPRAVIDLWSEGRITLCLSREIVTEYVEVLQRLGLTDRQELDGLLSLFARGVNSVFTGKTPDLSVVVDDPDDDKFVACAVALEARYVISGDQDLTEIGDYMGIRMVTPKQFLDTFSDDAGER